MDKLVKLYKTSHGLMYLLETDTVVSEKLRSTGDFAPDEKVFLSELITQGDTVLDVGANIGNHTRFFSQVVGSSGRVLSFEPQRFLFHILCANVLLGPFRNVWTYRCAVGNELGAVEVPVPNYERPNNYGGFSLSFATTKEAGEITTIDNVNPDNCHLIKIDVEGMELSVLQGAFKTIQRTRPFIYFEDNRPQLREELLKYAHEVLEYRLYRHRENVFGHHREVPAPPVATTLKEIN